MGSRKEKGYLSPRSGYVQVKRVEGGEPPKYFPFVCRPLSVPVPKNSRCTAAAEHCPRLASKTISKRKATLVRVTAAMVFGKRIFTCPHIIFDIFRQVSIKQVLCVCLFGLCVTSAGFCRVLFLIQFKEGEQTGKKGRRK